MTSHVIYILSIYVKRSRGSGRIDRNSVWSPAARHHTKSTMKDARSHFLWLPFSLDSFLSGFFPPWLPSSLSHLTSLLPPSLHSSLPPSLSALLNVAYTLFLFCSQQANLLSFASNRSKANLPPSPASLQGICSCISVEILRHRRANNGCTANNSNGNGNRRWRDAATAAADIETNGNSNCPSRGDGGGGRGSGSGSRGKAGLLQS